jgi:SAM-dependent methyltransferase
MLVDLQTCRPALRCPRHRVKLVSQGDDKLVSECADNADALEYPVIDGMPILIDFRNSILDKEITLKSGAKSVVNRRKYSGIFLTIKRILSPPKKTTRNNVSALMLELKRRGAPRRLLMIGGGTIGQGMEPLYTDPDIHIYAFDIYRSPNIQFVADAHQIPMPDEFFDAAVIQAVLEHVLQPSDVVAEIWRVLKNDGLVYAETPFMQHVHEGALDFTRFTESGHRYLFRRFDVMRSGASGGPGIQFLWSIDYLVRSLFRSRTAGKLAKLVFFWVQYLDALVPADYAIDAASGVFFLGRKAQTTVRPSSMLDYYQGAQQAPRVVDAYGHLGGSGRRPKRSCAAL